MKYVAFGTSSCDFPSYVHSVELCLALVRLSYTQEYLIRRPR